MRRPLVAILLAYTAGICCHGFPLALTTLYLFAAASLLIFLFAAPVRRMAVYLLIFFCGWINSAQRQAILSPFDVRQAIGQHEALADIEGILTETPKEHSFTVRGREGWISSATVALTRIKLGNDDWLRAEGKVSCLTLDQLPATIFQGQTVNVSGVIHPIAGPVAKGLFDYRQFRELQGIYYELETKSSADWQILSTPNQPPLADLFLAWGKRALCLGFAQPDESIRLEYALTLGIKSFLPEEVAEPFVRASTYHIFAVDGLRIAIISLILMLLLKCLGIPKKWRGLITLPLLIFYAGLTGWPASAIRAIVMAAVIFGSWFLRRPTDFLNSLLAAALIILGYDPLQLFQAGFQLSFVVVLFIVLLMPHFEKLVLRILKLDPLLPDSLRPQWQLELSNGAKWLLDLLFSSVAALVASIPLTAQYFHVLTPFGFLPNLPAIPLCALVLTCNLLSIMVAGIFPWLAIIFNNAAWACMNLIQYTSSLAAHLPGACFNVTEPGWLVIFIFYALLAIALTPWFLDSNRRIAKLSLWTAALIGTISLWISETPRNQLTVIPCKKAQVIFLSKSDTQGDWLLDCGNDSAAKSLVKPFLQAQGVNRLDYFVLTHGANATTSGADRIITNFRPKNVVTGSESQLSPSFRETIANLKAAKIPVAGLDYGKTSGPWRVLHPEPVAPSRKAEDNVLVLRGEFGKTSILLLSALSETGQKQLLNHAAELKSDIVVANIPSEGEPLIPQLLNAIQPVVIILSEGATTRSSDFKEKLWKRLLTSQAKVFFTSECGAVTIQFTDTGYGLTAMNEDGIQ